MGGRRPRTPARMGSPPGHEPNGATRIKTQEIKNVTHAAVRVEIAEEPVNAPSAVSEMVHARLHWSLQRTPRCSQPGNVPPLPMRHAGDFLREARSAADIGMGFLAAILKAHTNREDDLGWRTSAQSYAFNCIDESCRGISHRTTNACRQ